MAIQLYCPECKSYVSVASKKCPKCESGFPAKGRKYRVDVTVKGRRITRFVDNLTIAREVEGTIRSDLVRGEFDIAIHKVQEKPLTLGEVWEKHYVPWAKEHKKSFRDDSYYYHKHLEPRFADKALADIQPLDIERMKSELKKGTNAQGKPYSAQTIKHQIVIIRRLYNLARKWNLYDGSNPVDRVSMPKVDNQVTEFMTEDELSRLMNVLDEWHCRDTVAFIKVALFTGLRRGELFKLKWEDVDFDRAMITLRSPKGGKTTTLPLNSQSIDVISSLPRTSSYVFPGKEGAQRTDFKGPWQRIRKAAGLPEGFRLHGLRHHFASTLVSNGVDMAVVSNLLTHKDMGTTQRYAHLMPQAVKDAVARAGELLTQSKTEEPRVIPIRKSS